MAGTSSEAQPGEPSSTAWGAVRQRLSKGIPRVSSSPALATAGRPGEQAFSYDLQPSMSSISLPFPPAPASGVNFTAYPSPLSSVPELSSALSPGPTSPQPDSYVERARGPRDAERRGVQATARPPHSTAATLTNALSPKRQYTTWAGIPRELKIHILSYLRARELIRASCVNTEFNRLCFDGQLWTRLDVSQFYDRIPPGSLMKLVENSGAFIKDLNLRGCIQIQSQNPAEAILDSCRNILNASFEGCQNLQKRPLYELFRVNDKLSTINLAGLRCVTNAACTIIGKHCPQLQALNVNWCKQVDATGLLAVVEGCRYLKELRAGEVPGFTTSDLPSAIFKANRLERLVLFGCDDLTDTSLKTMLFGTDHPEMDFATGRPRAKPRRLRHLDLSGCFRLSNEGIKSLAHFVPQLEALQLNGCSSISDESLALLVATTPELTHLELDDLAALGDSFLANHLALAACASKLAHLSVGYCENIGDTGMVPIIANCRRLSSVVMDNTRVSNLVLVSAVESVQNRSTRARDRGARPRVGLRMDIYDCQNITWTGVVGVLCHNADVLQSIDERCSFPAEAIGLKCFYGWQLTVDEHMRRIQSCDFAGASRLCKKWTEYMQAAEEAGVSGTGSRLRRRRRREAQMVHAHGEGAGMGRLRARTIGSCIVM